MLRSALLYVDQVARDGSIRKAAERLHLSASAVNRQLLHLEEELGVSLFDRLPRGVRPTAAGELLLGQIRRWDGESTALKLQLQSLRGGASGVIRIVAPELTTDLLLPEAMRALRERFPRVTFDVFTGDTPRVLSALLNRDADVGLGFNVKAGPRLRIVTSVQPKFGAVMAPDHPLAQRKQVSLGECAVYPLIVPGEDWIDQTVTQSLFPGGLADYNVVARGGRAGVLRAFARAKLGVTFLTRLEVESDVRSGQLVHVPLSQKRIAVPTLSLLVPARETSAGVVGVFVKLLEAELGRI
ncbi:MAG: transcriptional regulator protein [Ramlibacter sp.]|nr:transcriptional regulator protein [Ramlibacter sp.]MDB5912440.1 transcriptional regulator protein [Ramlibacter sp.]